MHIKKILSPCFRVSYFFVKKKTPYRYNSNGLLVETINTIITYETGNNRANKYSREDVSNTNGTSTESVQYTYY